MRSCRSCLCPHTELCCRCLSFAVMRGEGGDAIRVTMKGHAFSVPKDSSGLTAHAEGTLVKKAVDPETVAHYEGEGATDAVPEKGKQETFELVAAAVEIEPREADG